LQALILAAGLGNRMKPLTDTVPKPLLQLAGRSILERIVAALLECGVEDITVVTGYREQQVRHHLAAAFPLQRFGFVHNERYAETNNIHSVDLALAEMDIHDDLLLIESDLIFDAEVLRALLDSPYKTAALVDRFRRGMDGTVVTIEDDVITSVIPPHLQGRDFDFTDKYKTLNIYRFEREFCAGPFKDLLHFYTEAFDRKSYYELILGALIYLHREQINGVCLSDELSRRWAEVDDPNDLWLAEFSFNESARLPLVEGTMGGYWNLDIVDFAFIRNMYFPTASMHAEMKNALGLLVENYGSTQARLCDKLGYALELPPERVVVLNGASEYFPILRHRQRARRALIPSPTFGEYSRTFHDAQLYNDHPPAPVDLEAIASHGAEVVVFVNPNNPTGSTCSTDAIFEFARQNTSTDVVVDESFIDFAQQQSIITRLAGEALPNVVVLKSLSKALGIPGVRLGYLYSANEDTISETRDAIPIWNINSLAEFFLELFVKNRPAYAASIAQTVEDREDFRAELEGVPLVSKVFESGANFVLVRCELGGSQLQRLSETLLARRIYVKNVSPKFPGDDSYLRLAVRSRPENNLLCQALHDFGCDR